jgi:serine-type D-Ala-D-Ala carboxypeptidase/endopeptidase (penicillin-binding protein 4)
MNSFRLSIGLVLVSVSAPAVFGERLSEAVNALINGPDYKHAHWGILVVDRKTGTSLFEHNADKLFAPASTTKLFSVAAALDALGADYRFKTPIVRRGNVNAAGELHGDLILVASGDLTMGGRTDAQGRIAFKNVDHTYGGKAELTEPDSASGIAELARQVARAGIKRVRGDVLIDDRLFEPAESTGSGPTRVSPIVINDNVVDVTLTPAQIGSPASIAWRPMALGFSVDARVETIAAGKELRLQRPPSRPGSLVLRGEVAQDSKPLVRAFEVEDAASFARALLIQALQRENIVVNGSALATNRAESLPAREVVSTLPKVALLESPPFAENVKLILKVSHNLHASTLPLLLAAKHGKRTLAEGLRLQGEFLARAGVDVKTISFGGAAGGARSDFSTPRATVQLLRHMATRADFATYDAALPVLGVDGTLADVLPAESPARGKVRAKTGTYTVANTMNGGFLLTSKALAGYMTTAGAQEVAFAMFVNNTHLEKADQSVREGKTLARLAEILYLQTGAVRGSTE